MDAKELSLEELLDVIDLDAFRGIIDRGKIMESATSKGLPRLINDKRGELRYALERVGDLFEVTQYQTELATESNGEIYPNGADEGGLEIEVELEMDDAANDNGYTDMDLAA